MPYVRIRLYSAEAEFHAPVHRVEVFDGKDRLWSVYTSNPPREMAKKMLLAMPHYAKGIAQERASRANG